MQRAYIFFAGICLLTVTLACGADKEKVTASTSTLRQEPEPQEVVAAQPFDLMSFSALDTNSGVFHGEYEEKVNDEITVRVGLDVTLRDGRITDIALLDTAWVRPEAARLMPQRIIEQQRLPVESVTGASVASWSIMAATAVALEIDLTELEDQDTDSDTTDI